MRRVDSGPRPVIAHVHGAPRWRPRRSTVRGLVRVTFVLLAAFAIAWPLLAPGTPAPAAGRAHEWPHAFEGRELRPLALGAVEQRFADRFPGAIGRFDDGRRVVILRHVTSATRMLHPAADCFRGLGYEIADERLERHADGALQRCFVATRDGTRLRVCERIVDANGVVQTDTSSWYWAAALGRSTGPWLASTTAEAM